MKKMVMSMVAMLMVLAATAQSKVYLTREISPESLVKIYKALGVDEDYGLRVRWENGEETTVRAGEVSVRGLYGYV